MMNDLRFLHFYLTISFFFSFYSIGIASETNICKGVTGIWMLPGEKEQPDFQWRAHWIWADEEPGTSAIFARKKFSLSKIPAKVFLRITASSQYQLFINNAYVCRGPARCAAHHQSYDILEIGRLLKEGENVLAVRIHYQKESKSYQQEGRAGLLAQLNFENGQEPVLITDSSWKVTNDFSCDNNAPLISRWLLIVNDRIDFRNYPADWISYGFDDSKWQPATELMRKAGWPAPQKDDFAVPLTPPWTNLVPRDIPYLTETDINTKNLIEAIQIESPITEKPVILTGRKEIKNTENKPLEIPACEPDRWWLLLFDFGELINGMPVLDIQGAAGTEIEIVCAPYILNNTFTHVTVVSEYRDRIILSGKRDRWECTYFKPVRYLGIIVKNSDPVQLWSSGIHQIKYPFHKTGNIESDDAPWLNKYMNATAKTINVCTSDAYTDNYRERRQYAQTGYYGALGNYWIYGDYALQRRYLVQVAQEQLANGIMPAYAPRVSDDYMIILDSDCLWMRSLRNYYLFSGDEETVRELLPAAEKLMQLLHSYTNRLGLLENPPYPYWLDHAVNDRRGANLNLNGHYLGALEDYAEVLGWLQLDNDKYRNRAKNLRSALNGFWDGERKLFADALVDGKRSELYSEHAQAMVLAMNVATKEQAELIAGQLLKKDQHNYIKRESGITMVTPAMSYFLHKGLCNYGYIDESMEMFRNRFDKMLSPLTNGTLWEEWWLDGSGRSGEFRGTMTRSDAQTESAFPPALFAEYLLGLRPTKPGMKEIEISRTSTSINNLEGIIPTPYGELKVEWKINDSEGVLTLNIPAEIKINVSRKNLDISKNGIRINGEKIRHNSDSSSLISLKGGVYNITF